MDKKSKKLLQEMEEQRRSLRSFGNVFPDTTVFVRPEEAGEDGLEINLKTPNLIATSMVREKLKKVFGIDVKESVFRDMVELQSQSGLDMNKEEQQMELNMMVTNMIVEKYIVDIILRKAIFESIKQSDNSVKTELYIDEDGEEFKALEDILNLFFDYHRDLKINKDEIPESTINEVLVLALMFLCTPS